VLPNCTSWQIPGGTIQCKSPTPDTYPSNGPGGTPTAIPGSPSKCNCNIISLPITAVPVMVGVAKSCDDSTGTGLTSCNAGAEGNTVTYHAAITNKASVGDLVVDQICDNMYGTIYDDGAVTPACPAGTLGSIASTTCAAAGLDIAAASTATCDFTAVQGELAVVTDILTVAGHSGINTTQKFTNAQSNSVTVTSSDAPSTATVTPGLAGTDAGCATVRYSVDVHNSSGADETLSLSALTEGSGTGYGDITKVLGSVLGTTCGVTGSGKGTLSTSTGAGALPQNIAPGGDYTCQFAGQFCSALDQNSCISQTVSVSATMNGDEGVNDPVTVTVNTLTAKECFTAAP